MTSLRAFKSKYISRLLELKNELLSKYPEKSERISYLTDMLMNKLRNLRTSDISDYLFTVYQCEKEFNEFRRLQPPSEEVDELLEEDE
jgi:uncharacterized protein YdhG (YjbR/CyaY superfamily)